MGSRNISITDEAYDALSRERRKGESFTEAILRLATRNGRIMDSFGTWEMNDKEKKTIFESEIPRRWSESTKSLKKAIDSEVP